jgi:hypothetical protein
MIASQELRYRKDVRPGWHGSEAFAVAQELNLTQWSICIGIAATLVVVEELIKLVIRRHHRTIATQTQPAPAGA